MAVTNCRALRYIDSNYETRNATTNSTDLTYEAYRTALRWTLGCFRSDQDNKIYVSMQINHNRRPGTVIHDLHMHYIPMVAPGGVKVCRMQVNYQWCPIGQELLAPTGWTAMATTSLTINPGDEFKHLLYELISTPIAVPAGDGYSSLFACEVTRLGAADAVDDYEAAKAVGTGTANLGLLFIDCHYEADRDGSINDLTD
jgi:hypothetical protein